MAENTKIEWAHHTFNPWIGCQAVSPACDNCYAKAQTERFGGDFSARRRTSVSNWKQPLRWNKRAAKKGIRYRVFCASLADVFDNAVPVEWREDLFELIRITPNLDWLLLTKRPQNIVRMVQSHGAVAGNGTRYLPETVWLGTTAENQDRADKNIPALLSAKSALGAKVAFVSIEPMLGPIDLNNCLPAFYCETCSDYYGALSTHAYGSPIGIDWIICGGESGKNARPMHPDWVRSLRDQCRSINVPFLFKQWGEWLPDWHGEYLEPLIALPSRHHWCGLGKEAYSFKIGKQRAGRMLDGVLHDEYPRIL